MNVVIHMNSNSLSHSICGKIQKANNIWRIKRDIGKILRDLLTRKGIEIIEAELCIGHIRMPLEIPAKYSGSEIMLYLIDMLT